MIDRAVVEFELHCARVARIGVELACRDLAELAEEIRRLHPTQPCPGAPRGAAPALLASIVAARTASLAEDLHRVETIG
jgi:hypothetical protein